MPETHLKPSHWSFLGSYLGGTIAFILGFALVPVIPIIGIGLIIIGALAVLLAALKRHATTYRITNAGVEHEYKLLIRRISSVTYSRIQNTTVHQGILDRVVNIGTIQLDTAGGYGVEMELRGVKEPVRISKLIGERIKG